MQDTLPDSARYRTYLKRLNRVAAYIRDHLDDDLDLNRLADVAHMSPYHWHRVYRAVQGETITATVKRLRLNRAASLLTRSDLSVEEIGKRSGYTTLPSFSRAFKAAYGLPPGQYRDGGSHHKFIQATNTGDATMFDVTIQTIQPIRVLAAEHTGAYTSIDQAFGQLFGWLAANNMISEDSKMFGIFLDDPDVIDENKLRSRACISVPNDFDAQTPFTLTDVGGGDHAVLEYTGPYSDMLSAYRWLFGTWLTQSDREAADIPVFESYLNNPQTTPPAQLRTDIHLPLA